MGRDGEGYDYDDEDRFGHMDDEYGEGDDKYFDCHLGPDGKCAMAGSEDCDWDCPHSHGPRYAGSAAWNKAHDEGAPILGCECGECRRLRPSLAELGEGDDDKAG